MAYKGLNYESIRINTQSWNREQSGYFKINPRGKIPALVDGDYAIYESTAIMAYLEAKHLEKSLMGVDLRETGLVWQAVSELINYLT